MKLAAPVEGRGKGHTASGDRDEDPGVVEEARRLTGLTEKTALLHEGLRALIERESARRLALLGGTEPLLKAVPRRRIPGP